MRSSAPTALAALALCACVGVSFGSYPEASGTDVLPRDDSHAGVDRPDFSVDIAIEGFDPDWGLVGLLVPIVPVGPWKWLGFVPKSEMRVEVQLALEAKLKGGSIVPGSARILVGSQEYRPTEVRIAACQTCKGRVVVANPMKPIAIVYKHYVQLRFGTCPPPEESFALEIDGLPRIDYAMVSHVRGKLGTK